MTRCQPLACLTLAATILFAAHALALETLPGEPPVNDSLTVRHHVEPFDEPLARGRVIAVDRAGGRVTLEYPPIPELFLEGGKRIFAVKDPVYLKALGPGDKVRFDVEREGRTYTIKRIENSN